MIKTPLRYPGGKAKALPMILSFVPSFSEYREPFVGGGSVYLALKQKQSNAKFWVNDLNKELYFFWFMLKENPEALISEIQNVKDSKINGKELYTSLLAPADRNPLDRAVRFFLLNRMTFSGTIESGGYSQESYEKRFTQSSIERLKETSPLLKKTEITNSDFSEVLSREGDDVFIFLDPPYFTASKLYGKKGDLHEAFDHERFADVMKTCKHRWLITYDDCPEVREMFSFASINSWEFQYGMNNYGQEKAAKGKEVIISNFESNMAEL